MERLTQQLVEEGYLKTPEIIAAFDAVPREAFLSTGQKDSAHESIPLPIGYGQTISQPQTVAFMLELLHPTKGNAVLDIGIGSGWTTALLAYLVGPAGMVVGIERIPQLLDQAREHLKPFKFMQAQLRHGDGTEGAIANAPFDCIHVGAAATEIPQRLKTQLKIGGRLVMPIGEGAQSMVRLTRTSSHKYAEDKYPGFYFVPLIAGTA